MIVASSSQVVLEFYLIVSGYLIISAGRLKVPFTAAGHTFVL